MEISSHSIYRENVFARPSGTGAVRKVSGERFRALTDAGSERKSPW